MSRYTSEEHDEQEEPKKRDPLHRLGVFLYGITIGLLKEYQEKSFDFAKLATAAAYMHSVKTLRRYCLYLLAAFMMLVVIAFAIVAVPLAFIALGPWSPNAKLIAVAIFAAIYLIVPLVLLRDFLSEKKWLQVSKSEKLLRSLSD